jgi:hypothetical protein
MSLMITGLVCAVLVVLLAAILQHQGSRRQEREQQEMMRHVRREANSKTGWKEYQ